jgi:hypothetical protein
MTSLPAIRVPAGAIRRRRSDLLGEVRAVRREVRGAQEQDGRRRAVGRDGERTSRDACLAHFLAQGLCG